jgi:hypothetical protein
VRLRTTNRHALSHALFEDGAGAEAEALIADWLPGYDRAGVLKPRSVSARPRATAPFSVRAQPREIANHQSSGA